MSEPMSNVEIEDVLSSIRRLVSDDLRPQARPLRSQPDAAPPAAPVADKLVLTPALRIVSDAPAEPDLPAAQPEVAAEPVFHTVRGLMAEEAGFIAVEDDEPEAVLAREMPPIEAYDDDGAAAPVDVPDSIPDEVFLAPESADAGRAAEAWEPPAAEAAPENWAEAAEAAVRAELEQDAGQSAFARFVDEPEDLAFDEAAMRELVRDIIREELQGTLGERITRNVRKLVRAEIARALAVRDFD